MCRHSEGLSVMSLCVCFIKDTLTERISHRHCSLWAGLFDNRIHCDSCGLFGNHVSYSEHCTLRHKQTQDTFSPSLVDNGGYGNEINEILKYWWRRTRKRQCEGSQVFLCFPFMQYYSSTTFYCECNIVHLLTAVLNFDISGIFPVVRFVSVLAFSRKYYMLCVYVICIYFSSILIEYVTIFI